MTKKPLKIALIGKMGSGKTTVADFLAKNHAFRKISFATPLKEFAKLAANHFAGREIDKAVDRPYLQALGMKGRDYDVDLWVNLAVAQSHQGGNVVIDDMRFVNEAKKLKREGFILVKLDTSDEERVRRLTARDGKYNPEWENDPSEAEVDSIKPDVMISGGENEVSELIHRIENAAAGVHPDQTSIDEMPKC